MSIAASNRTLAWDWYRGTVPENVQLDDEAYLETTYSFFHYRSQAPAGVRIGHGATVYLAPCSMSAPVDASASVSLP